MRGATSLVIRKYGSCQMSHRVVCYITMKNDKKMLVQREPIALDLCWKEGEVLREIEKMKQQRSQTRHNQDETWHAVVTTVARKTAHQAKPRPTSKQRSVKSTQSPKAN